MQRHQGQSSVRDAASVAWLSGGLVALTFLLILIGVLVRATGSGLGCGTAGGWHDWPLCDGGVVPPPITQAIIEYSHRILAFLLTVGTLAIGAVVARSATLRQRLAGSASLAIALLVAQIFLGAVTVRMLLPDRQIDPTFIVVHLGAAMAFFGTVLVLALETQERLHPRKVASHPGFLAPLAGGVAIAVYLQTLIGGMVAANNAGLACPDFPLCNGVLVPTLDGLVGLQVIHRLGAFTVVALVLAFAGAAWRHVGPARSGALAAVILVAGQFALGVTNVLERLPLVVQIAHLGVAFLLFGVLVATAFALRRPRDIALPGTTDPLAARGG